MADLGKLVVEIGTKLDTGGFDKLLGQLKVITIAGAAVTAGFKVLTASIDAASESEQVVNKLTLAMKNQGIFTEKALQVNLEFANSLMKVTATSDEEITKAMEVLTTYGLHDDQLRKTIKTTLDFAKAKGIDLVTASNLVGKAFLGETGTMTRYGIVIDKNTSDTKKFESVMTQLNTRFGGTAQNDAKTYAGQMQTFKNNMDELYESIGKRILPALTNFIDGINSLIDAYDRLNGGQTEIKSSYIENSKYEQQLKDHIVARTKAIEDGDKAREKQIDNAIKDLVRLQKADDKFNLDKKKDNKTLSNSEKLMQDEIQRKSEETAKKKTEDAIIQDMKTNELRVNKQAKDEEARIKDLENTVLLTTQLSTTFGAMNDYQIQGIQNKMNTSLNAENADYQAKRQYILQNVLDKTEQERQLSQLEQTHADRVQNIKTQAEEAERKARQRMKPFMIAEAIANTALGATKAFSQGGFLLGAVMAALVVAAGMAQVATISAQRFAKGGMVNTATAAVFGEAGTEVALPLTHPNTITALSNALQQAMGNSGGGGNIYVTVPPISTRQEAKKMGEIVGNEIYNRVKRNRKV